MGIFSGCLLASDVDETLYCEGKIPEKNLEKIDFFIKEGGIFALSSGRSREALGPVLRHIDKSKVGPSVTFNGAFTYDFSKDEILAQKLICDREKELVKYVAQNMPDIGIEVHTRDVCYVPNRTDYTDDHEEYECIAARFESFEAIKNLDWLKVLYLPCSVERRLELRKIAEDFSDKTSVFYDSSAVIVGNRQNYLEQMESSVSKGNALYELREKLGIKKGGLFAIGDYYNDLSMLKEADVAAVTEGAPDDLKQMAEYITCSCTDGAVADFIDYLTNNKFGG